MEIDATLHQKVDYYKPSQAALDSIRDIPLLFLVGITGAGKNSVKTELLRDYPDHYYYVVSHTTRSPRENDGVLERDGVEYHFIDFATAEKMIDNHEFLEAKIVHFENIYGTSIAEIKKAGAAHKIATTDIDIQGVDEYLKLDLNVKPVFLLPPNYDVWMERLLRRYENDIDKADLLLRMKSALIEIQHAIDDEHYYIVVNDDLDDTVKVVQEIATSSHVEPHYYKAMKAAEDLLEHIRSKINELESDK